MERFPSGQRKRSKPADREGGQGERSLEVGESDRGGEKVTALTWVARKGYLPRGDVLSRGLADEKAAAL